MKKMISILLSAVMILSIVPMLAFTASAIDYHTVYIGDIHMTDGDILLEGASETVTYVDLSEDFDYVTESYAYFYDGKLRLNNFTYEGSAYGEAGVRKAAIRGRDIQIQLYGENEIICDTENAAAIYVTERLEFEVVQFANIDYLCGTLDIVADNGIMVMNYESDTEAYYSQAEVKINIDLTSASGRGLGIGVTHNEYSNGYATARFCSGEMNITGFEEDSLAGIELKVGEDGESYIDCRVADFNISGCEKGMIAQNIDFIGGSFTAETTNGSGIEADMLGEVNLSHTSIDITVSGDFYPAIFAGELKVDSKTMEMQRGNFEEERVSAVAINYADVAGVRMNDGEYLAVGATEVSEAKPASGGYAYYVSDSWGGHLELHDFEYEGDGSVYVDGRAQDWIDTYDAAIFSPCNLDIKLFGQNSISSSNIVDMIMVYGTLEINGDGNISLKGGYSGFYACADYATADAEVVINSGSVYTETYNSVRIYSNGLNKDAILTINGGTVDFSGGIGIESDYNGYASIVMNGGEANIKNVKLGYDVISMGSSIEASYTQNGGKMSIACKDNDYAMAVMTYDAEEYSKVTINGGTFILDGQAISGSLYGAELVLGENVEIVKGALDSDYLEVAGESISTPETKTYSLGDINMDETVNQYDYILAKRAHFNTITFNDNQKLLGDMDGNSKNNQYDYILIKRIHFKNYTTDKTVEIIVG